MFLFCSWRLSPHPAPSCKIVSQQHCWGCARKRARREHGTGSWLRCWRCSRRLYRVMHQVSRVLARMQAGTLRTGQRKCSREPIGRDGSPRAPHTPNSLRFRYGWAWLIRLTPRAAQYAPQVQLLLDEPEMQAALAASPSLRRAMRPLCRGLAFPAPPVLVEAPKRSPGAADAAGFVALALPVPGSGVPGLAASGTGCAKMEDEAPSRFVPPSGLGEPSPKCLDPNAPRPPIRAAPPDGRNQARLPVRLYRLFTR